MKRWIAGDLVFLLSSSGNGVIFGILEFFVLYLIKDASEIVTTVT
jgi:hypothetical protein